MGERFSPENKYTYEVIGSAMAVLNELGPGLHEKPYENALVVELKSRAVEVVQQQSYPVHCRGVLVAEFVPDLLVGDSVIVDAKVIDRITDHERGQMLNYLRITKRAVGLVVNFQRAKLEWERIVL